MQVGGTLRDTRVTEHRPEPSGLCEGFAHSAARDIMLRRRPGESEKRLLWGVPISGNVSSE